MSLSTVFCISVVEKCGEATRTVLKNCLKELRSELTWKEVFVEMLTEGADLSAPQNAANNFKIEISSSASAGDSYKVGRDQTINTALSFNANFKFVKFYVEVESSVAESPHSQPVPSAFQRMMSASSQQIKIPRKPQSERFTAKDRLHNELCDDVESDGLLFTDSTKNSTYHISNLVNCLWYLDGNKDKIQEQARQGRVKPLPDRFLDNFNNFNDWKKKKRKRPNLDAVTLKGYSEATFHLLSRTFTLKWNADLRRDLEALAMSLSSYSEYLQKAAKQQLVRQNSTHPAREVSKHVWIAHHPMVEGEKVSDWYSILDELIMSSDEYVPVYFQEDVHLSSQFSNRMERSRFLDKLSLSVPVDVLRYDPGGACGQTVFVWRTPANRNPSEVMTATARVVKTLEPKLPEYHTHRMRKEFSSQFHKLEQNRIPPHLLRAIYADLSLDASAEKNPMLAARVEQAILSDDPGLVIDMRHVNPGRPGDTFDVFFSQLSQTVEEMCAADERRHGIEHFSKFISTRDLRNQVAAACPDNTPIPSESTLLFAFVPKNSHTRVSKLYKKRVNLKFQIQTRQLRAAHIDEHYAAAVFKYMKCYAVRHKSDVTFLCVDDKSKIDFGEPGSVISTGVRGRQSLVPSTSQLSALDHDVSSKGSLTPSVCLKVELPEVESGTFYRGQVTVTLKDSIFQPSCPFRHAAEMISMIRNDPEQEIKPVLMIFSDGGPDHRLTYISVKLALIAVFKELDLDCLIAGRTAPGHSWANPAERIMSLLNIAYQNVALSRAECSAQVEQVLRTCNSMDDIRKKAEKDPAVKPQWLESIKDMVQMLSSRGERVQLKGETFKCQAPAREDEVTRVEETIINQIDQGIQKGNYQKKNMEKNAGYHTFITEHCRERQYTFQIKKCLDQSCCKPLRQSGAFAWLPDPEYDIMNKGHYCQFNDIFGKETSDKDRPSLTNVTTASVAEAQQGCKNSCLTAQNVRGTVPCYECSKPRCIYAKTKLTLREQRALKRLLERHDYSCGSLITPEGDLLHGRVFVRLQLACNTPIEFPYYSSAIGSVDICSLCSANGGERDAELLKQYRVVLPICAACSESGKTAPKRLPIKN